MAAIFDALFKSNVYSRVIRMIIYLLKKKLIIL